MWIPFLRNIYSEADLQKMKIEDIEKYNEIFDKLVDIFSAVESALEDGDISVEFKDFMLDDLDNVYSTVSEMKGEIDNIAVNKKDLSNVIIFQIK